MYAVYSGSRSPLLSLVSYMYVNYVDCGTAGLRHCGSKDQQGQFDSSVIFRDVYINILCKLC